MSPQCPEELLNHPIHPVIEPLHFLENLLDQGLGIPALLELVVLWVEESTVN